MNSIESVRCMGGGTLRTKGVSPKGTTTMTTQPENNAEQKISKDELNEKELEKVTGGDKGKVTHSDLQIVKLLDAASPKL